jgi:hypothetical protein
MPRSWLNVVDSIESEKVSNERKGAEEAMTNLKTIIGLLAAVVAIGAFAAAQASASSAPIVISYTKTCAGATCVGTTGDGDTLRMAVTGFRATGDAAQLTLTEWIIGGISITAELSGHRSPAGFIVLNGTVTSGPFAGAQIHQRSNLTGAVGNTTTWEGELRLMPASA